MSGESNYKIPRERISVLRGDEPVQMEILRLLDALYADMKGELLPEVHDILTERWHNS